jgi:hypothetical protein
VVITEETIDLSADPIMVYRSEAEQKALSERQQKESTSKEFGTGGTSH